MRPLYQLLRGLRDRYGDGKEPLPDSVKKALEKFVALSHGIRDAVAERAKTQQAERDAR